MGVIKSGHNSAGFPNNFGASDAVTADALNDHVNDSTFNTTAVDDSTIEVYDSGAKIRVKDDGVTFAKMQNISTDKVLGRTTAGSGAVEEVSLLDEDDMNSNSDTAVATQQSIKAYVDTYRRPNIVHATKNTAETITFSSENETKDVAGLEVTITPRLTGSTFIISGYVNTGFYANNRDFGGIIQYKVNSGSYSAHNLPTSVGNRIATHFKLQQLSDDGSDIANFSWNIPFSGLSYSAGDTLTFKLVVTNLNTTSNLFVNRSESDGNDNDNNRVISTIIVQEV